MITMSMFNILVTRRFQISLARIIAGLCVVAALASCSTIKLAYGQAPDLLYWWLDGYLDLNDAQSVRVRAELSQLHTWHRKTELPKVSALLQKAQTAAAADISGEQACGYYQSARQLWGGWIERAIEPSAELVMSLQPEQLEQLSRKYAKSNDEFLNNFVNTSAEKRDARRLKQFTERSEMLYGNLDDAQLASLRRMVQSTGFDAALIHRERLRRQTDALQMLRQLQTKPQSATQVQTQLRAYIARATTSPDPTYRDYAQRLVTQTCDNFAQLHNSTTPAQRSKAAQALNNYDRDAKALLASN
jgi:hypothetical protein